MKKQVEQIIIFVTIGILTAGIYDFYVKPRLLKSKLGN